MTDHLEELEKVLGKRIERRDERVIPGTIAGRHVLYFSDDGSGSTHEQFQRLTTRAEASLPKSGGASERGCTILLADGSKFHAVSYHGDIEGWRNLLSQGARSLGLSTAVIVGDHLVISDGRQSALSECKVEFY